ncbi:hypothetical protein ACWGNE_02400 [Streptomyces xiamenensis]
MAALAQPTSIDRVVRVIAISDQLAPGPGPVVRHPGHLVAVASLMQQLPARDARLVTPAYRIARQDGRPEAASMSSSISALMAVATSEIGLAALLR